MTFLIVITYTEYAPSLIKQKMLLNSSTRLYGSGYLFNLLASTPKGKFRVPQLTLHAGLKEGLFAVRFDFTSKQNKVC
jgi:hypothetical protein